eukprot:7365351-Alexandrium_andersonii.AAC.1
MARHESNKGLPGRVTILQRAGPAGPMIWSHSAGGSAGRGPVARGPSPCKCRNTARRLAPQSPPAIAV